MQYVHLRNSTLFFSFILPSFAHSIYFSAQCLSSFLMQDKYLNCLYIKHFHSLHVDMYEHGHRMLIAQNPGVHLAHWYIINNPCNCFSKHTDVSLGVALPMCLCPCVSVCEYHQREFWASVRWQSQLPYLWIRCVTVDSCHVSWSLHDTSTVATFISHRGTLI